MFFLHCYLVSNITATATCLCWCSYFPRIYQKLLLIPLFVWTLLFFVIANALFWNSIQHEASPLEIPQNCVALFAGNSTWFFLNHSWKFLFFLYWPLEFPHSIFLIPLLKIPCPQPTPSPLDFFWNNPISKYHQWITNPPSSTLG